MLEYRCPNCRHLAFKAGAAIGVKVETKCRNCRCVVEPLTPGRLRHVSYRCTSCTRTMHCENPVSDRKYCIACGTETLQIVVPEPAEMTVR